VSIRRKTGQHESITAGSRALQFFTDRYPLTCHFAAYINDDPAHDKILFFYGDGGNGKSLLLRYLRERCCKRFDPENWAYLTTLPDDELVANIEAAEGAEDVPYAALDFDMTPRGEDRPQEPFSALLMLRRTLSRRGLHFPLYDFASILYLHHTNQLSHERVATLFPPEEMDLIGTSIDTIASLMEKTAWGSLTKSLVGLFNKRLGQRLSERFTLYLQRRKLSAEEVQRIMRMDADKDLIDELPSLFAEDLNASMALPGTPKRLALFFDTHEAFWRDQRHVSDARYFERDKWLRRLLCTLDLEQGIVAVVAGRDRPRWHEATDDQTNIPESYIDAHLVGHLPDADARTYLDLVGVTDAPLQEGLLRYARVAPNEYHPYYLGLCTDVVLAAKEKGVTLTADSFAGDPKLTDKGRTLVNHLLKYTDQEVEDAIYALSACRSFDWEIYRALGQALHFYTTRAAFDILTQFSFVWRSEQRGAGWYRIHDLLRRLLDESADARVQQAHAMMEQYYREHEGLWGIPAVVEAIYHVNRQDWERGVDKWIEVFDQALQLSRYEDCRTLLEVRTELRIDSDVAFGRVAYPAGKYSARLSRHAAAEQEYRAAVAVYNTALQYMPDNPDVLNNKGIVLQSLGALQHELAQHELALSTYRQAIAACDAALHHAPELVGVYNSKSGALRSLGTLQSRLSQFEAAQASFRQAVEACDAALSRAPDDVEAHYNRSIALRRWGNVQARLAKYEAALESYQRSIAACDAALQRTPNDLDAHLNKSSVLRMLGVLQTQLTRYEEALASYQQSIDALDVVLQRAPDDVNLLTNKGLVLHSIGILQARLVQYEAALASYRQALAAYDAALRHAPNNVYAHHFKAATLRRLADLQAELAEDNAALLSYEKASDACDVVLQHAPDLVYAHNNKGDALRGLANLQTKLAQRNAALVSYGKALAAYNEALQYAPDDVYTHKNKGNVLRGLGDVQAQLAQPEAALVSYRDAIVAHDAALRRASDDIDAYNYKGQTLYSSGKLHRELDDASAALTHFQAATVSLDRSLQLAPDDRKVRQLRSEVQQAIDALQGD